MWLVSMFSNLVFMGFSLDQKISTVSVMSPLHIFLISTVTAYLPLLLSITRHCLLPKKSPSDYVLACGFLLPPSHTATPKLRVLLNKWACSLAKRTHKTGRPKHVPWESLEDITFPRAVGCTLARGPECLLCWGGPVTGDGFAELDSLRVVRRTTETECGVEQIESEVVVSTAGWPCRAGLHPQRAGVAVNATGPPRGNVDGFISLNTIFSRFIHVAASIRIFFLSWLNNIPSSGCTHYTYWFTRWWAFPLLLMLPAAVVYKRLFECQLSVLLGLYLGVELLGPMGILGSTVWGTVELFCTAAALGPLDLAFSELSGHYRAVMTQLALLCRPDVLVRSSVPSNPAESDSQCQASIPLSLESRPCHQVLYPLNMQCTLIRCSGF